MVTFLWPPQSIDVTVPPIAYTEGGVSTPVTPLKPLPSGLYIIKDGVVYPVRKDTAVPANTVSIPVELSAVSGPINVTAGDLNVQLTDLGANFDAARIGDGSGVYLKIEPDGKIGVLGIADIVTALGTLNGKDFATQTTLAALLAAFNAEDFATQTTLAALLAAFNAEDFASETKLEQVRLLLASLDGKDYATQTTLNALLTAFNAEDFASETKLEAVRLLLASIDGKDFATQTTLSALNAKFNSLGQKTSANSAPVVLSPEQEAILSSLATKLDSQIAGLSIISSETNNAITSAAAYEFVKPAGAKQMQIYNNPGVNAGQIRWRPSIDGADPTATIGACMIPTAPAVVLPAGSIKVIGVDGNVDVTVVWFG